MVGMGKRGVGLARSTDSPHRSMSHPRASQIQTQTWTPGVHNPPAPYNTRWWRYQPFSSYLSVRVVTAGRCSTEKTTSTRSPPSQRTLSNLWVDAITVYWLGLANCASCPLDRCGYWVGGDLGSICRCPRERKTGSEGVVSLWASTSEVLRVNCQWNSGHRAMLPVRAGSASKT